MSKKRSGRPKRSARRGDPTQKSGDPAQPRVDRKTRQLCGQVAQTLNEVLWGECGDDLLRTLYVSAVDPAPDATRLLVTVQPQLAGVEVDVAEALERLAQFKGLLRSEVAASIHRKKTPDLVFTVKPTTLEEDAAVEEATPEEENEEEAT